MRASTAIFIAASAACALAADAKVEKRQIAATTVTGSDGQTIVNSGISGDNSATATMMESGSESRPPGAESSLAIVIDGSTMYESGMVTAGPGETANLMSSESGSTVAATTAVGESASGSGSSSSSGLGSRMTQAPILAGGVAALALLAV